MDVDVTVIVNGIETSGEVTLVRDAHGWRAYGDAPEYWVSGAFLRNLRAYDEGYDLSDILTK